MNSARSICRSAGKPVASLAQFRKAARRDALGFVAFGREFRLRLEDNTALLSEAIRARS